jgi:hypothetical protein
MDWKPKKKFDRGYLKQIRYKCGLARDFERPKLVFDGDIPSPLLDSWHESASDVLLFQRGFITLGRMREYFLVDLRR